LRASAIPIQGRATQGKQVLKPAAGDRVVEVARVAEEDENPAGGNGTGSVDENPLEQFELLDS
jgi:hypothetical protein